MTDQSSAESTSDVEKRFAALCEQVCEAEGWRVLSGGAALEVRAEETGAWRRIDVECHEFEDEVLARMWTELGPAQPAETTLLTMALRLNFALPQAGIAIRDDVLVLYDAVLASDPDADELETALFYLAEAGESLARSLFGGDED
jgi:hypothetical protein